MNFGVREFQLLQRREGSCEEEEEDGKQMMLRETGNHPFQFSPPTSSFARSHSSQYKAAVAQPKGRWGAQIYENNLRVWPGTFEREEEGATAYDQDAVNFRGHKADKNFNPLQLMDLSSGNSSDVATEVDEGGCGGVGSEEKENMFEKVVTPSDVGKLNRLVIPKQHAEKYLPLDWTVNEKGLLLNFEDLSGKSWRFRYSYWNSSQSYVMTKGWSRFVKEKKLVAGDIVSFHRGVGELGKNRFYIDCKHRPNTRLDSCSWPTPFTLPHPLSLYGSVPCGRILFPPTISMSMPGPQLHPQQLNCDERHGSYGYNVLNPGRPLFYAGSQTMGVGAFPPREGDNGSMASPIAVDSVPLKHYKAAGKRLRLFGVNLDCPTASAVGEDYDSDLLSPTLRTARMATMPSSPSLLQPPPQLTLFNGESFPIAPSQLSRKGKEPLSLGLDV